MLNSRSTLRPPPRGLVGNAGALLGSRVLRALLSWAGTIMVARTLSPEEFGQFTLVFTVLGLMSVVTDMGIGRLAVRGILDDHSARTFPGTYLALRSLLGLVGYVTAVTVVLLLGYPREVVVATAVAGVVIVLATPSNALLAVFQARMRLGTVSIAETAGTLAQLAFTAAVVLAGGTLLLFVLPALLYEAVVLVWKITVARRMVALRPRFDLPVWRGLLREALPLSIGYGLLTIYTRVDAVMLSKLSGFESVGIYGVSYKFVDLVHFVSSAVTIPLLTLLVRSWPQQLEEFRAAVRRAAMLLSLAGGLALTGILGFIGHATDFLYGHHYAAGAHATRLLTLAEMAAFATSLALCCLIACERHRHYPLVVAAGLVSNVALNFVLIPRLDYDGAALATLVGNGAVAWGLWWLLLRVPGVRPLRLGRAAAALPAAALGLLTGWLLAAVVPWPLAAAVSGVVYVLAATGLGLSNAAGLRWRRTAAREGTVA